MTQQTRSVEPDDVPQLLALNNLAVPAVNELDEPALRAILAVAHASFAVIDTEPRAAGEHPVLGFVVTLAPGAAYLSENYTWFEARSNDFLYVDRIVVAEDARDRGVGAQLYRAVFDAARAAGAAEVFCEVNLEPPNPGSLRFHRRLGFEEVGQQATKGGEVVVSLLAAPVG